MKTLLALLLTVTPAFSAEVLRFEEAPARRSAPASTSAAPILEPGSDAPLKAGPALDFPENSPEESTEKMLDPKDKMRKPLDLQNSPSSIKLKDKKRGFKPVVFAHGRQSSPVGQGAAQLTSSDPMMMALQLMAPEMIGAKEGSKILSADRDMSRPDGQHVRVVLENADGTKQEIFFDPLVFDLDGDGVRMSRRTSRYDANGDNKADTVNEISSGDGLLVLDSDHDGVVGEGGLEAFGNATDLDGDHKKDGFADGYDALWALARKAQAEKVLGPKALEDNLLDADELKKLAKAYGLAMKVGSVLKAAVSLEKAGVLSIALPEGPSKRTKDFDGQGNERSTREGAVFKRKDGSLGLYSDIWFELEERP